MSNIGNYKNNYTSTGIKVGVADNNTEKVRKFVEYLHDFLPVLEREFDNLEKLNEKHSNAVFPIKMQALSEIYKAAGPLYEWYCEKKKRQI